MNNKILAIGEIIWDVYSDKQVIGGAPLNFASHVSLCGGESYLVSAVGKDSLGEGAIKSLEKFSVGTDFVKISEKPTGQCLVTLDENGVPDYNVLTDVAYDNIILSDDDIEKINALKFDAFYFGTLIQRNSVSRKAVQKIVENCHFSQTVCDVNMRKNCYEYSTVKFCLEHATVLKVSLEEEPILEELGLIAPMGKDYLSIAKAFTSSYKNIETVVLTLGKDGSFAYISGDDEGYYQKSVGDKVVSTVGAGDSFCAAFITSYLGGEPVKACMERAAKISGFVVSCKDAVPLY